MHYVNESSDKALISGYKDISLVDVLGHPSFTIWFAYCNFRCPWCQNWPVVTGKNVSEIKISELLDKINKGSMLVDFVHVTGGEPTLQPKALKELFSGCKRMGLRNSLNTNGYNYEVIDDLAKAGLIDHFAMDFKAPLSDIKKYLQVIGLSNVPDITERIKRSIEIAGKRIDLIEIRTTLIPLLDKQDIIKIASELKETIETIGRSDYHFVIQQFVPNTNAPDPRFRTDDIISINDLIELGRLIKRKIGLRNVYIRSLERGLTRILD